MYYGKLHPTTSNKFSEFDRVKVEDSNTAFHEGREFRMFKELNIAVGTTYVIQAVVAVDTILLFVENFIDSGALSFKTWAGGTPGGTFTPLTSIFYTNNMAPGPNRRNNFPGVYVRRDTLFEGGTYHFTFENLGNDIVTGTFKLIWEELPPGFG